MPNECPKKEIKTNHVQGIQKASDCSKGEYEPDTNSTEEMDASGSIRTYKNTVGTPKKPIRLFQALEFTFYINGKSTRVLADIGAIGGILINN